jgi:hypothetical protein
MMSSPNFSLPDPNGSRLMPNVGASPPVPKKKSRWAKFPAVGDLLLENGLPPDLDAGNACQLVDQLLLGGGGRLERRVCEEFKLGGSNLLALELMLLGDGVLLSAIGERLLDGLEGHPRDVVISELDALIAVARRAGLKGIDASFLRKENQKIRFSVLLPTRIENLVRDLAWANHVSLGRVVERAVENYVAAVGVPAPRGGENLPGARPAK